jgi:ParB-like chromosome segregation protein Spo0J
MPVTPTLQLIPISHIHRSHANPRSDPDADLDGLAASIGTEAEPTMVQPPVVEQVSEAEYTIIAGERRILAARQAGWQSISCVVHPHLPPVQSHMLRLAENLHRRDLHPLDEAAALKIAWLSANAEASGLGCEISTILAQDNSPAQTLGVLEKVLGENGFSPNHPAIKWDDFLKRLGLDLDAERRKKLLGVLNVETGIQEQVRTMDITEAALRSIGSLDGNDQIRLVQEVASDPRLKRKIRRIARVVRDGSYTLDEALAEARGQVLSDVDNAGPASPEIPPANVIEIGNADDLQLDDRPMRGAMELLEIANRLTTALATLAEVSDGDLSILPQPWGEYTREALHLIQSEIQNFAAFEEKGV